MFPAGGFMEKLQHLTGVVMNSSNREENILPKWPVLLVLLAVTAVASAQQHKPSAPAAQPHAAAPSSPAPSAQHASPAQRPRPSHSAQPRPAANAPNLVPPRASP